MTIDPLDLAAAIRHAADVLDPFHQADCWPDPIEHDGRPLQEQARDALVLLEADDDFGTVDGDPEYAEAARRLAGALIAARIRELAAEMAAAHCRSSDVVVGGAHPSDAYEDWSYPQRLQEKGLPQDRGTIGDLADAVAAEIRRILAAKDA